MRTFMRWNKPIFESASLIESALACYETALHSVCYTRSVALYIES